MDEKEVLTEQFEDEAVLENRGYSDEILSLIRSGKSDDEIAEGLENYHDNDIASVVEELSPQERERLYEVLGPDRVSDIFAYLDDVSTYIEELDADEAADVIENMDADDAIDILDELDEDKRQELMQLIEPQAKEDIELIRSYDDGEFGSIMTTNFIDIKRHLTVKQAMKALIDQAADNDNISTIYVVEDDDTFYGAIDLKDLIIARQDTPLEDLITTSYPFVYDNEIISDTIEQLKEYSEDSIPVLSSEDKTLIGVITSQDIVEIVDNEMGDDYAKLAGLTAEEDLKEPLLKSMRKRIPWLVILLFLGLLVSSVVAVFEPVVSSLTLIICFQSLILGMAGNVGTQSLAVTIRVLTDENLNFKKRLSFVLKEMRVGFCNGLFLGIVSFVLIGLYIMFFKDKPPVFSFATSGCAGLALCISMTVSSLTGTVIPLIFKSLKIDPAVASGPLITTVNDLVAVVTYYGLAWLLLINFAPVA